MSSGRVVPLFCGHDLHLRRESAIQQPLTDHITPETSDTDDKLSFYDKKSTVYSLPYLIFA